MWVISQQDADGILGLADLSLEIRDLRIGGIEHLPGLKHVQPGRHTVLEAHFGQLDRVLLSLDGLFGDLELQVEVAQQEIVAGDIAHQESRS